MTYFGRVATEEICWRTNFEATQRPKRFSMLHFPHPCFHIDHAVGAYHPEVPTKRILAISTTWASA